MSFYKSLMAATAALGLLSAPASAGDLFGTYGENDRATMVSYSLPFGGSAKSNDEAAFALSLAGGTQARINTSFQMNSLTLNGQNVMALNDRLNADQEDDGLMAIVVVGAVIGGAFLVANELDDDNQGGKKKDDGCEGPGCGGF